MIIDLKRSKKICRSQMILYVWCYIHLRWSCSNSDRLVRFGIRVSPTCACRHRVNSEGHKNLVSCQKRDRAKTLNSDVRAAFCIPSHISWDPRRWSSCWRCESWLLEGVCLWCFNVLVGIFRWSLWGSLAWRTQEWWIWEICQLSAQNDGSGKFVSSQQGQKYQSAWIKTTS